VGVQDEFSPVVLPEEVLEVGQKLPKKGVTKQISVNVYERNPEVCRKVYRTPDCCYICQFEFVKFYWANRGRFYPCPPFETLIEIGQDYELGFNKKRFASSLS